MYKPSLTTLLPCLLALLLPRVGAAAQTCQTATIAATTPTSQFTIKNNGTVTDKKNRLMWKQCPEGLSGTGCTTGTAGTYTWQGALNQAQAVNASGFAGHADWRVPNIKELRSITEKQCYEPAINLTVFPNTSESAVFWSSSPSAYSGGYAWDVYFYYGFDDVNFKDDGYQVRLVRSGQ